MQNDTREVSYVDTILLKYLKSISESLKTLSSKRQKRQSSFNPKFYAIYRHYLKYVQHHPWYTKKLSVVDFYCRILTIAYKCNLINPKLVIACKNDYVHIKKEYENAHKYLIYLGDLNDWIGHQEFTHRPGEIDYTNGPHFHGKHPSRRFLVRLQYDPTSNLINATSGLHIHNPIVNGLRYKKHKLYPLDDALNRQAFFFGECSTGYPCNSNSFVFNSIDFSLTPYSTTNKMDYLIKLKESEKDE